MYQSTRWIIINEQLTTPTQVTEQPLYNSRYETYKKKEGKTLLIRKKKTRSIYRIFKVNTAVEGNRSRTGCCFLTHVLLDPTKVTRRPVRPPPVVEKTVGVRQDAWTSAYGGDGVGGDMRNSGAEKQEQAGKRLVEGPIPLSDKRNRQEGGPSLLCSSLQHPHHVSTPTD